MLRWSDRRAFGSFVVGLYLARGWSVTRESPDRAVVRTDDRPDGRPRDLAVVHARTSRGARRRLNRLPESADIAVTNVAVADVDHDAPEVRGPDDLYDAVFYGTEREVGWSLVRTHLPTRFARRLDAGLRAVSSASVLVAVVSVLVVVAGSLAIGTGSETPAPDPVETESVGTTPPPAASWTVPRVCPRPPVAASPSSFRPDIVAASSASGMDGWRLIRAIEFGRDEGPLSGEARPASEVRSVATYEEPGGDRYRLRVDRWQSVGAAVRATERRADTAHRWLRLGPYTLSVTGYAPDGERLGPSARSVARLFLASVSVPGAAEVGSRCVEAAGPDAATAAAQEFKIRGDYRHAWSADATRPTVEPRGPDRGV